MVGSASLALPVLTSAAKAFLALQAVESIVGLSFNAFMVGINVADWAQGRSRATSDNFMVALGICNICFQCAVTGSNCCDFLWWGVYPAHPLCPALFMLMMFSALCGFWMTTWLCVFYCVKICNFSTPFFLCLKMRIKGVVPWLLLGSVLISLATNLPVAWSERQLDTGNATTSFKGDGYYNANRMFLIAFGYTCPLILVSSSASVILISLCRHTCRIQHNLTGFSKASVSAHCGAGRTVLSLLLLFLSYHALMTMILTNAIPYGGTSFRICLTIISCYPSAHSLILIIGNAKLKKAATQMFCGHKRAFMGIC